MTLVVVVVTMYTCLYLQLFWALAMFLKSSVVILRDRRPATAEAAAVQAAEPPAKRCRVSPTGTQALRAIGRPELGASVQVAGAAAVPSASASVPTVGPGGQSIPSLRGDGPSRLQYARGKAPDLSSTDARQEALARFDRDLYAAGGATRLSSKLRSIEVMLNGWGTTLLPLSAGKVRLLGASLKAGHFRSFKGYLNSAKLEAIRQQQVVDLPGVIVAIHDAERSCGRGLGGPRQAEALPFERLGQFRPMAHPLVQGGPVGPGAALILGSWFLTREVELANARAAHCQIDNLARTVTWLLPASKTDQAALGAECQHGCACGSAPGAHLLCPFCVAVEQRLRLWTWFPQWHSADGQPHPDLPLFPTALGVAASKAGFADTISEVASRLGLQLHTPDGWSRFTGHSLRVTGAQALARAGFDPWLIALLARWGSNAVLGYIRAAPLCTTQHWARSAASSLLAGPAIVNLREDIVQLRGQCRSLHSTTSARSDLAPLRSRIGALEEALTRWEAAQQTTVPAQEALARASDLEEMREQLATAVSALAQGGGPWGGPFVTNNDSQVVHLVAVGRPSVSSASWKARCGWKFGLRDARRVEAVPEDSKLVCEKCLPDLKRIRKVAFRAHAAAACDATQGG